MTSLKPKFGKNHDAPADMTRKQDEQVRCVPIHCPSPSLDAIACRLPGKPQILSSSLDFSSSLSPDTSQHPAPACLRGFLAHRAFRTLGRPSHHAVGQTYTNIAAGFVDVHLRELTSSFLFCCLSPPGSRWNL